ncbi:MAG TPA: 4Fe-4S binding protein [Polyangiaceae bacterium]|nr:MAG: ferredoxin [Deltaproteobacteria bacterium ADurb.Bin207]HNS99513.1 4Fe-4S binding protein [Polyangiaceae bacterium]HNZ21699.1 4Fe-4S binding protein [Polyangiaceae bacterium]HOD21635.1 4Fe-4S binding protein [Polyangiaceae bacterium]HOE49538.1 4Fe-4S binding protein [Polyangiaceae bacterium]
MSKSFPQGKTNGIPLSKAHPWPWNQASSGLQGTLDASAIEVFSSCPGPNHAPVAVLADEKQCIGCGFCLGACAYMAISFDVLPVIHPGLCQGCGDCVQGCPVGALELVARKDRHA